MMRQLAGFLIPGVILFTSFATWGLAASIPLGDPSFEDEVRAPSATPQFTPGGWAAFGGGGVAGRTVLSPMLPGQHGPDVGYVGVGNGNGNFGVWFIDTDQVRPGTYSATVALAKQAGQEPSIRPFKINFEAVEPWGGGFLLQENLIPQASINSLNFSDFSGSAVVPSGSAQLGKPMRLVLVMDNANSPDAEPVPAAYLMDNVRLNFTPEGGGPSEPQYLPQFSFQNPPVWAVGYTDGPRPGSFRPETPLSNQTGDQVGVLTRGGVGGFTAMYQDGPVIEAGTYTLSAAFAGDSNAMPDISQLVMKFEAVGTVFEQLGGITLPGVSMTSTLTDYSTTITIAPDSNLIGQTLRSVLTAEGADNGLGRYFIDNVRLTFTPVPEASTCLMAVAGFATLISACRCRRASC